MHASACNKLTLELRYAREFASLMNIDLLLRFPSQIWLILYFSHNGFIL